MKTKFKTPDPKKARRYFSRKLAFTTGPVELSGWLKERKDVKVLDVRDAKSFANGHIPGALNLPEGRWGRAAALDKSKTYIVYCETPVSHLAARAALDLSSSGLPVMELEGGFQTWKQMGKPVEKGAAGRKRARHKPLAKAAGEMAKTTERMGTAQPEDALAKATRAAEAN